MDLQERMRKIGIDVQRAKEIKKMPFEAIWLDNEEVKNKEYRDEVIEIDKIVGTCRRIDADSVDNWLDYMGKLRKLINFDKHKAEQFEKLLLEPKKYGVNEPEIIVHNGKYYIYGEGNHRITIAKCIGGKQALAVVGY